MCGGFTPKRGEPWFRLLIFYSTSKAAWAPQQQQQSPTQVWATHPRPMTGTPSVRPQFSTDNKVSFSQQGRANENGERSRRFTAPLQLRYESFGLIIKLLSDRKIRIPLCLSLSVSLRALLAVIRQPGNKSKPRGRDFWNANRWWVAAPNLGVGAFDGEP